MLVPFLPSLFQPQRITWSWAETRHEFLPEPPLEAWLSCLLGTHFLLSEEQTSPCVSGTRGCPKNSDPGLWGGCTGVLSTACRWPAGGSQGPFLGPHGITPLCLPEPPILGGREKSRLTWEETHQGLPSHPAWPPVSSPPPAAPGCTGEKRLLGRVAGVLGLQENI